MRAQLNKTELEKSIKSALREDLRTTGDITTDSIIPMGLKAKSFLLAKEDGRIAGLEVAMFVFKILDSRIKWKNLVKEGSVVKKGKRIAEIEGNYRALLTGERTALNFLQRISGIATAASRFVKAVGDLPVKILDTRKTVPGLRLLDKYAVKAGGGTNHRMGLFDMVMIKDNHIKIAGGITAAVNQVKKKSNKRIKIEVETTNLKEVREALNAGADIIMLDNMKIPEMKKAVKLINGRALTEASGNVNIKTVRAIAKTGVDFISVGSLTHSVKALDIAMYIEAK